MRANPPVASKQPNATEALPPPVALFRRRETNPLVVLSTRELPLNEYDAEKVGLMLVAGQDAFLNVTKI